MPFYEYINDDGNPCDQCEQVFIVSHSIKDDAMTCCPKCGAGIKRLISLVGGIVTKNREANQYNDIQYAKYWRDKNGVRHKVTQSDGSSKSTTVSQQLISPEEAQRRTKEDKKRLKKEQSKESYRRYVRNVFKNKKQ